MKELSNLTGRIILKNYLVSFFSLFFCFFSYAKEEISLIEFSKTGDVEQVRKVLNEGVFVDIKNDLGQTALHWASFKGHFDVAKLLIEAGADPDARDIYNQTSLHLIAQTGNEDIAKLLLEAGANPEIKGKELDVTPLHIAAYWGSFNIAKLLLEAGANPHLESNEGETPLQYAKEKKYNFIVRLIAQYENLDEEKTAN